MAQDSFDCIVIGSGPGGYVAAIRASQLGMKTAVIERTHVGGRCLNVACIPAKAVLRSADILTEVRSAGEHGIVVGEPSVDFPAVAEHRAKVIGTLTGGVEMLLKKNGIELIEAPATLTGGMGVKAADRELEATKAIILATGSVGRPIPGAQFGGRIIGTEEAWALDELPASMAVVGAGASGCEIASAYARFGTAVTLYEVADRVLPTEDPDVSRLVERAFKKQGIEVVVNASLSGIEAGADSVTWSAGDGQGKAEWMVISAGRGPDEEGLGLATAGVELGEDGRVKVDGQMRTTAPGIFAIGDIVPGPALAHKASEEGIIAAEAAAGQDPHPLDYLDIPRATFCEPNVGSFGLTEAQAKEAGYDVTVGKVPFGAVGAGAIYDERSGMVKLVGDRRYGELLGASIVGYRATDLIQELVNAKLLEGGYPEVARMIHGHPTLSEAVMEAARAADGWLVHG